MVSSIDRGAEDARRVEAMLGQLKLEAANIALNLGPQFVSGGVSMLLKLEPDSREMLLDSPAGIDEGRQPPAGHLIGMSFRLDGALARCAAPFERLENYQGRLVMRLRYPRRIDYLQHRQAYRAVVETSVAVRLIAAQGDIVTGELLDLSSLGFGAVLKALPQTREGDLLTMDLTLLEQMNLPVQLLHSRNKPDPRGPYRVGGRFVDISPAQQQSVDRAVADLQGQWLRAHVKR